LFQLLVVCMHVRHVCVWLCVVDTRTYVESKGGGM
jgi:hypothetical protein